MPILRTSKRLIELTQGRFGGPVAQFPNGYRKLEYTSVHQIAQLEILELGRLTV